MRLRPSTEWREFGTGAKKEMRLFLEVIWRAILDHALGIQHDETKVLSSYHKITGYKTAMDWLESDTCAWMCGLCDIQQMYAINAAKKMKDIADSGGSVVRLGPVTIKYQSDGYIMLTDEEIETLKQKPWLQKPKYRSPEDIKAQMDARRQNIKEQCASIDPARGGPY